MLNKSKREYNVRISFMRPFSTNAKSIDDIGDKHTYFFTSKKHAFFSIKKIHVCSWLFKDACECVEIGLLISPDKNKSFITEKKSGETYVLPITIWAPWINPDDGHVPQDLYAQISNQDNARLIFNDDCKGVRDCVDWGGRRGRILTFTSKQEFCVLPVDIKLKKGAAEIMIHIPEDYDYKGDVYVRFCSRVPERSISYNKGYFSKKTYIYNININQMRNAPHLSDFNGAERCDVQSVYAIHIVPSEYSQTFVDQRAFVAMRFVEADKYKRYIDNIDCMPSSIGQDELFVSFNKLKRAAKEPQAMSDTFSFCSVFEKDHFGRKACAVNGLFALVGAVVGFLLSLIPSCMHEKVPCSCRSDDAPRAESGATPQPGVLNDASSSSN